MPSVRDLGTPYSARGIDIASSIAAGRPEQTAQAAAQRAAQAAAYNERMRWHADIINNGSSNYAPMQSMYSLPSVQQRAAEHQRQVQANRAAMEQKYQYA